MTEYLHGSYFSSAMQWAKLKGPDIYLMAHAIFGRWEATRTSLVIRIGWITTSQEGNQFTLSVAAYCPLDNSVLTYEDKNSNYFDERQRCIEEVQAYCEHHKMLCMGVPPTVWVNLGMRENAGVTRLAAQKLGVLL